MKIFEYKNISKTLIFTTIAIILSNTLLISLVYYNSQLQEFETTVTKLQKENLSSKKEQIKQDILSQAVMLKFKYENTISTNKANIINYLKRIPFDQDKSDYIFVYEVYNLNGGDNFAKLILNPNRKDLEGKFISTNYTDVNGFKFREKFIQDIKEDGESFVKYAYKKTNGKIAEKISFFYYIEDLEWILAKGVYVDDIQHDILLKKKELRGQLFKIIHENIIIYLFFTIIMIFIAYFIGHKIARILKEKDKRVRHTTKELARLNRTLDQKVKQEIEKNKEKEQLLMQKSKFIALGEMISLIAHQWRQPLSEIGAIIMNLQMHDRVNKLDSETLSIKSKEIETILHYMSTTIDDFRYFFKPDRKKQIFKINESIQRVLKITSPMLQEHNIKITLDVDPNITLNSYQNELEQVLLNLISNAKDALVYDKIKNPEIKLILEKEQYISLKIWDNASGIEEMLLDKIFEPYFTTKDEAQGTGIGLYMSKIIIENNMKGKLKINSSPQGSCFIIEFY